MLRKDGAITIGAPQNLCFEIITNPAYLPRLLRGNLAEIRDIVSLPDGGYTYTWEYRWAGLPIKANAKMSNLVPYSHIEVTSSGGMETISTWDFTPVPEGTHALFAIETGDEMRLLQWISRYFIDNQLHYAVEVALTNIKQIAEQEARAQAAHD